MNKDEMKNYPYSYRLVKFYDDGIVCQNPFFEDADYKRGGKRYGYKRDAKINWYTLVHNFPSGIRQTIEMTDTAWKQVQAGIERWHIERKVK